MPGLIEIWSFGDSESNLLTGEEDWGLNYFFLNNGQIAGTFKSSDESNTIFDLGVHYLRENGTIPSIEEISVYIINDISAEYGSNYEKPGIYYEIDKEEEITEEDAVAWCKGNIYPYMMSEEEWYAVP